MLRTRLTQCFSTVFPALTEDQILAARPENVSEWDSIAAITLVNVIEEEFNVALDFEQMAELRSFADIEGYLDQLPVEAKLQ